ncbi:Two component transcriptional regulator, Fis [Bibersteinia trehalosi USDA-ARS-USMARC-190]|nr:response regulator [Bibersteinia trehalosi]AHG85247.1 Two component transcriptional regulator, Fis [Bibersteinia trehalosi USDA-ARS-USMARC-190]
MFDTKYNVLLIDDESNSVTSFQALLQNKNYLPLLLTDPTNIQQKIPPNWVGVVLCNTKLTNHSGLSVLKEIMLLDKKIPVIMLSEYGNVPMAVNAMKIGAINFLEKPISFDALLYQIENALAERRQLISQRQ